MSAPTYPITVGTAPVTVAPVNLALTSVGDPANPVIGDLHLSNGQIHFIDGSAAIIQKARNLFEFGLSEWFLNQNEGTPYFTYILKKNPNSLVIKNIIRKILLSIPGIAKVSNVTLAVVDPVNRQWAITWEATLDNGTHLASEYRPFVLTGLP